MKHLLLIVYLFFFTCISLFGQVNQVWWSKGRVLHVNPVAGIDSVTFGQFVNADTFLIVIDRASRRIVYDTINEHVPGMVFHDTIHTTHTVYLNPGRRIGVFSVAKDKQVSFSQGNLQYIQNQNIWKFADQQYEYIGAGNVKDGELANKIDLFGWSANNTAAPFGVSTSTNATDYAGEFVDWGVNEISGDAPNTWRTLKSEEWSYILDKRKNANKLRSKGSINGKRGYIILPDNWQLPNGVSFVVDVDNFTMNLDINSYTFEEWKIMENAGAIFLPTAGRRENLTIQYIANYCGIWTSDISEAKNLYFNFEQYQGIYSNNIGHTYHGRSIRLVYDTIMPKPSKRIGVFSVAKDKQVSFSQGNLQYVQSRDKWQFANTQYEYMGNRHFVNGQLADTIEYFGWSGKNSNAPWGISLSIELSDYKGEFLDWGTNVISGDVANTWRTLSNDELIYLCQKRENASQLLGLGYIGAISGLIILPDDWVTPEGLQFTPNTNDASLNQYTKEQWAIMENVGAVFIPATGYFNHKLDNMRGVNEKGYYRVSTLAEDGRQMYLVYGKDHITYSYSGNNNGNLFYAFPVRLVHDTIVPPPAPEYVDLGLSVKWATFNIGASAPEDYGDYFAWGEVEPKDEYNWANYKWCNGGYTSLTKYCSDDTLCIDGFTDGLTQLVPEDDAAHVNWGGNWHIPSDEEWAELRTQCQWTLTENQGVNGYEVKSKVNGNTIFIPIGGFLSGKNLVYDYLGGYWSTTLNKSKQSCALGLYLNKTENKVGQYFNSSRSNGFLIRPVYDDKVTLTSSQDD